MVNTKSFSYRPVTPNPAAKRPYGECYWPELGLLIAVYDGVPCFFEARRQHLVKWTDTTLASYMAASRGKSTPRLYDGYGWYHYLEDAALDGLPYTVLNLPSRHAPQRQRIDKIAIVENDQTVTVFDDELACWYSTECGGIPVPPHLDQGDYASFIVHEWRRRGLNRPLTREEVLEANLVTRLEKEYANRSRNLSQCRFKPSALPYRAGLALY